MTGRKKTAARGNPTLSAGVARPKIQAVPPPPAEVLRQNQASWYRSVINALTDGLVLHDSEGTIIDCNVPATRLLGLKRNQILGKTSRDPCWRAVRADGTPFPGKEHPAMIVLNTGRPCRQVVMGLHLPQEVRRWININAEPLFQNGNATLSGVVVTFSDITERIQVEQKLEGMEARYQDLYENAPDMYLSTNPATGRVIRCNQTYLKATGYTRDEVIGRPVIDIFQPEFAAAARQALKDFMSTGSLRNREMMLKRKDGSALPISLNSSAVRDEQGRMLHSRSILRDITARKQAEVELRETSERLSLAQQAGRVGVFDWNLTTNEAVWTPELEDIFGLPRGGFEKRYEGWRKLVYPEDLPRLETMFDRWLKSQKDKAQWDYRYLRHGEVRWISARGQVFRDGRGKALRMIGTNVDITDLKRAEAETRQLNETLEQRVAERTDRLNLINRALQKSEEKFSAAFKHAPTPMNITRVDDGLMVDANDAFLTTTGYTRKEVIHSTIKALGIWIEPKIRAQAVKQLIAQGKVTNREFQFRTKNGELGTGIYSAHLIHLNNVPHVLSTVNDITERKWAAAALEQSEARFRQIAANIQDVLYTVDCQSREFIYMSPVFERMLGYTLEDVVRRGGREKFLTEVIQGGQFEKQRALFRQMQATPMEATVRWQAWWHCKDGSRKFIEDLSLPFYSGGKLQYTHGVLRDNTERVRLEHEILNISDWERQRIAQDLHDGLGQILVGAGFLAESLRKNLVGKPKQAERQLKRIQEVIATATKQARDLAHDVQPVEPEPNGLMSALTKLAAQIREVFHIRCEFKCRRAVRLKNHQTATHLFRIAQEAMTNAIKHGRAKRILIRLTRTPKQITLAVKDNGLGLTNPHEKMTGMGMNIMRYRAGIIGGLLTIQNDSAGGTIVACTVPISDE